MYIFRVCSSDSVSLLERVIVGFEVSVALVGELADEGFRRVFGMVQHRCSSLGKRAADNPTPSTSGDLSAMDSLLDFESDERAEPKWVVKPPTEAHLHSALCSLVPRGATYLGILSLGP